jgi:hypothetical protein
MKNHATSYKKDPDKFSIILLTYPAILENSTGTIDEIGMDIKRIKEIGISHIIFGYNFSPIGEDIDRMISITKQL